LVTKWEKGGLNLAKRGTKGINEIRGAFGFGEKGEVGGVGSKGGKRIRG